MPVQAPNFQELHGKYFAQTATGNTFLGTTTTASAIPISNTTAPTFIVWNPLGSGVLLVPVRYTAGWTGTTEAPGNLLLNAFQGAGAVAATGSLITAFTAATPVNMLIGGGKTSQVKFGTAATITAQAATLTLGLSHLTTTGTATFGTFTMNVDFDGQLVLLPGTAAYVTASAATASTYNQSLIWYESPV